MSPKKKGGENGFIEPILDAELATESEGWRENNDWQIGKEDFWRDETWEKRRAQTVVLSEARRAATVEERREAKATERRRRCELAREARWRRELELERAREAEQEAEQAIMSILRERLVSARALFLREPTSRFWIYRRVVFSGSFKLFHEFPRAVSTAEAMAYVVKKSHGLQVLDLLPATEGGESLFHPSEFREEA